MLNTLLDSGLKSHYSSWEAMISRKLNFNSLVGIFNMIVGTIVFSMMDFGQLTILTVVASVGLSLTIAINRLLNYVWAGYFFFVCGFVFLTFISLFMGKETYIIMFFFPMTISIVQLFGRKELFKHLVFLCLIMICSQVTIAIGFQSDLWKIRFQEEVANLLMGVNIVLSFLTTLALILMAVNEQLLHEKKLKKASEEKELLLAEVFHRVKNNLNIVTSLLNLKKNMSDNATVQNALEECRSRIYSMALVHETIFNNKRNIGLKLNEYIERLANDIAGTLAGDGEFSMDLDLEEVDIDLTTAVPCGMIINEVLTNAFKHAKVEGKSLELRIKLTKSSNNFELEVRDNGPGIPVNQSVDSNSLGMELIHSLMDQIGANGHFLNDNGLVFLMRVQFGSKTNPPKLSSSQNATTPF